MKIRRGPSGLHLFERGSGLNILIDEVSSPAEYWAVAPRNVSISLTNACDLSCQYCFAPKHYAKLHVDQLLTWMDELDASGCLGVGFGGGEPTLHSELATICQHGSRNTDLAITLTTHAHRLTDQLAEALSGNVHFIRVSMDGVEDTYERLRGRSFASLQNQLNVVKLISHFGINYVVNADTVNDLDRAIDVAVEAGASEFLLLPERAVGSRPGADGQTLALLRDWVMKYCGALPLRVSEHAVEGLPICNPFSDDEGLCSYAHISASGVLMRSSFDRYGIVIAEGGLVKALEKLRNAERKDQHEGLVGLRI